MIIIIWEVISKHAHEGDKTFWYLIYIGSKNQCNFLLQNSNFTIIFREYSQLFHNINNSEKVVSQWSNFYPECNNQLWELITFESMLPASTYKGTESRKKLYRSNAANLFYRPEIRLKIKVWLLAYERFFFLFIIG